MPRYSYVLLDADRTLFDFDAAEQKALRTVLLSRGYTPDEDVIRTYMKINAALWDAFARGEVEQDFLLEERFRLLQQKYGGTHDPQEFNLDYQRQLAANPDLISGALNLCRQLSDGGCTLAIVTNGATVAQRGRYLNSPIRVYVPYLFISQEIGVQKPEERFFDFVCQKMSISDRSRAVIVGDSLGSDILGGNRAGIDTIWYNPRGTERTGQAKPTVTVGALSDVTNVVLQG